MIACGVDPERCLLFRQVIEKRERERERDRERRKRETESKFLYQLHL